MYTKDIFVALATLVCLLISSVTFCESASANPRTGSLAGLSLDVGSGAKIGGTYPSDYGVWGSRLSHRENIRIGGEFGYMLPGEVVSGRLKADLVTGRSQLENGDTVDEIGFEAGYGAEIYPFGFIDGLWVLQGLHVHGTLGVAHQLFLGSGPSNNTTGILEFGLGYDFALNRGRTVGINTGVRFASIESQGATASLGAGVVYRWY